MRYRQLGHQSVTTDFCSSLKEEPRAHSSTGKKVNAGGNIWFFVSYLPIKPKWASQPSDADSCSMYLTSKHTMFPFFHPNQTNIMELPIPRPQCCRHWNVTLSQCFLRHTQSFPLPTKPIGLSALEYMLTTTGTIYGFIFLTYIIPCLIDKDSETTWRPRNMKKVFF